MSQEKLTEIEIAIGANLNAIDDRMTVHDSESRLTHEIQYHVDQLRGLINQLIEENVFENELTPE